MERLQVVALLSDTEAATDLALTVIGGPCRGKTTLIRTIKAHRKFLAWLLRQEGQPDQGVDDSASRTQGVDVSTHTTKDGYTIHILDLAGQDDFAGAHCVLHASFGLQAAAIIVTDGSLPKEEVQKDLSTSAGKLISKLSGTDNWDICTRISHI